MKSKKANPAALNAMMGADSFVVGSVQEMETIKTWEESDGTHFSVSCPEPVTHELYEPCSCGSGKIYRNCCLCFLLGECADCGGRMEHEDLEAASKANHRDADGQIVCDVCWVERDCEFHCCWCGGNGFYADEYQLLVVFAECPAIKRTSKGGPKEEVVRAGVYWTSRCPYDAPLQDGEPQRGIRVWESHVSKGMEKKILVNFTSRLGDLRDGMKPEGDSEDTSRTGHLCGDCCKKILRGK
jgi:hypothetical protein